MKKYTLIFMFLIILQYSYSQQFTENTEITLTGILYGDAKWIDRDNSGKQELLISGYDTGYNAFSGMYSYESQDLGLLPITIDPSYFSSIGKLDYNNDGTNDFIINGYDSNDNPTCKLYISDGNGSYSSQTLSIPGTTNGQLKIQDLNNDGLSDIIVTGSAPDYSYIAKLFLQDSEGAFTETTVPFFGSTYSSISTFDANGDGNIDVLLSGFSNSYAPETKLYLNDGAANFTESTTAVLANVYFATSSAADYDNDNDIDILLSGFNSSYVPYTVLYNNDGNGSFTENTQPTLKQLYWGTSNFVDYDNDGDLDIFISGADTNTIAYAKFYKNENGTLTEDTNAEIGIYGTYVSAADWSDYDNDGDLDFVLSGLNSNNDAITKVYINQQESLTINDFTSNIDFNVYPNPTLNKTINLVFNETTLQRSTKISVYSNIGQKVFETSFTDNNKLTQSLNLESLTAGLYILELSSGDFKSTQKVILK